jgi:kumamolisin
MATDRVILHPTLGIPAQATATGRTDPQQQISVSILVRRRKPLNLASLNGRTLSEKELAEQYGADPSSFQRIRQFATNHGLTIDEAASSLSRRTVVLHGSAQAMEFAFGVELNNYQTENGQGFHIPRGDVSISKEHVTIAADIETVLGLDARPLAKPYIKHPPLGANATTSATTQPFTAPQVAATYSFPSDVDGSGQVIALLELGGGFNESDLTAYFQKLGIKTPQVSVISVGEAKNSPGISSGADNEVALDIQVVGSIAPGARIVVYFAPNTNQGLHDALTTAIHDQINKPNLISISWGGPEANWTTESMQAFDNACQSAAALGITIFAAAGDNSSSDGIADGKDHVDFPASSPHVLACGGTKLIAQGNVRQSETVWNDQASGGGATGGGVSSVFAIPSWQKNIPLPPATSNAGGRGVPDVAGHASPSIGYQIIVNGQNQVAGGTSAVAPLWAALVALMNQKLGRNLGWLNPTLYQYAGAFFNISEGNNGDYTAAAGWSACTGLGSPDGTKLLQSLGKVC